MLKRNFEHFLYFLLHCHEVHTHTEQFHYMKRKPALTMSRLFNHTHRWPSHNFHWKISLVHCPLSPLSVKRLKRARPTIQIENENDAKYFACNSYRSTQHGSQVNELKWNECWGKIPTNSWHWCVEKEKSMYSSYARTLIGSMVSANTCRTQKWHEWVKILFNGHTGKIEMQLGIAHEKWRQVTANQRTSTLQHL